MDGAGVERAVLICARIGDNPRNVDYAFEAADAKQMPPRDAVLYVGSSSIRMWKTLEKDFPNLTVIKRGFGGSTIRESIRYADRIVIPYHPKRIVLYAGDNDVAQGMTAQQVFADYKEFVATVRQKLPVVRIDYQHDIDMQQVFVQAAAALAAGEQWWLSRTEEDQLTEYNARHASVSAIEELILDHVDPEPNPHSPYRTPIQVLKLIGIDRPTNPQCKEAGTVLRNHYGPPKRVQGRPQWRVPMRADGRY